jgi:outer membrane lipoprotein-sorting protein
MHLCLALLWSLSAAQAPAPAAASLPPARQVLERYLEVTGGRAAYEKAKHRTLAGSFELKGMGMKGSLLLQQSAPDKMRTQIDLPGIGTIVKGTDGVQAWELNAVTGPRLLDGSEKEEALLEAAFDADLHPERTYAKMETVRIEDVDGRPAYVLELTPRSGGAPRLSYYDKESGRLLKFTATATTAMGEVRAESRLEDYRPEGGIVVPHRVTLAAMGMEQVLTFDTLSTEPVPASVYAMPAEVKALQKSAPAAPAAEPAPAPGK